MMNIIIIMLYIKIISIKWIINEILILKLFIHKISRGHAAQYVLNWYAYIFLFYSLERISKKI